MYPSAQTLKEAKNPKEYLAAIDEPRKSEIKQLLDFLSKTLPTLEVNMWNGIVGYGKYHYKSRAGTEGDWFVAGLASNKNYISLYVNGMSDAGGYLVEAHKKELGKVNVGRSCIRFKKVEDVDLKAAKKLILKAKKQLEGQTVVY